jgi:hypothetical protein
MAEFTDTHRAVLGFERAWWKYAGVEQTAIRARFATTCPATTTC